MAYSFGIKSNLQRATLHPDLQAVLDEAIKTFNYSIDCGWRGKEAQDKAVRDKASKVNWPNSRHNVTPSEAADLLPYPFKQEDWKDLARFARMMGHVEAAAAKLGIPIELGMDWDMDSKTIDESFKDFPHVQLKRPVRKI
jgi:peptidoglycan L-alanyl-D-glutamate endopeptidase CwlK